MIWLWW